jgi:hypothetical protein
MTRVSYAPVEDYRECATAGILAASGPDYSRNLLALLSAFLGDVCNLMLEDKEVRLPFPREPKHVDIVIFDPASNRLPVRQPDSHRLLLLNQQFKIRSLFMR